MPTIEEKLAELRRTGIGEDVIQKMLTLPAQVKEEADKLGIGFKEVSAELAEEGVTLLTDTGDVDHADMIEVNGRTFKAFGPPKKPAAAPGPGPASDPEPDPGDPNEPAEIAAGEEPDDGDEYADVPFTDDELSAIAAAIGPAVAQQVLDALAPALDLEKRLMGALDNAKGAVAGAMPMTTKEKDDFMAALTSIATEVKSLKDTTSETQQQESATTKEIESLKATIQASQQQLADAQARLKALEGDVPSGIQPMLAGYRASQDGQTIATKTLSGPTDVQKPDGNQSPFINDFIGAILSGKPLS